MTKDLRGNQMPVIGIGCMIIETESGAFKSAVSNQYVEAVIKGGGVPIMLPYTQARLADQWLSLCDGLIMPGGYDIQPLLYDEDSRQGLGRVDPKEDNYQLELLNKAICRDMPVLGICKGCQLINVALGGNLYQDLKEIPTEIQHYMKADDPVVAHKVCAEPSLPIGKLLGKSFYTNSFHHQAIHKLGEGLQVMAHTSDGVVEAVFAKDKKFVWGIQWHPEMMLAESDSMLPIFKAFIDAAKS